LSLEIHKIAEAEPFISVNGNICGTHADHTQHEESRQPNSEIHGRHSLV
jgi:hypothetical protein